MKLDFFNPWKDLAKWSGLTIQFQTHKKGDTFITYIREKESKQPIVTASSRNSKEEAFERAKELLGKVGVEGVKRAIETGQMVNPSQVQAQNHISQEPRRDWRDGANHSYRAQKKIVGESVEEFTFLED